MGGEIPDYSAHLNKQNLSQTMLYISIINNTGIVNGLCNDINKGMHSSIPTMTININVILFYFILFLFILLYKLYCKQQLYPIIRKAIQLGSIGLISFLRFLSIYRRK